MPKIRSGERGTDRAIWSQAVVDVVDLSWWSDKGELKVQDVICNFKGESSHAND
jgi:hypothetical protein